MMSMGLSGTKCSIFFLWVSASFLSLTAASTVAQPNEFEPRVKRSINDGWKFSFEDSALTQTIDLPHTWNAADPFNETPGYLRTVGIYSKTLHVDPRPNRVYILEFEAVNQEAEIWINGQMAGHHVGGYTGFTVNATPYLENGKNAITVRVDNRHNKNIPPLKGDFNFYGGIYRDVWLLELSPVHFGFDDYGASQVFVTTPNVSQYAALVKVRGTLQSSDNTTQGLEIEQRLLAPTGEVLSSQRKAITLKNDSASFVMTLPTVENPQLWHPDHPYLYTLVSEIVKENQVIDRVTTPVGFRWFRFDADSGFYLNGKPMKLMGVNRHQDYSGIGNALSNARHMADIELAKATGANFLRTAHYPQDPAILEACDRLGLLVSMEIPLDHEITDSREFYKNTIRMQREMIRQNFNHPSIIIWAYMNEMLLGRNWEKDKDHIQKIADFARELEAITRNEDPTRYTMIPNHGQFDLYKKSGLTDIPMIVGWNLYFGWYEEALDGLGEFMDRHHTSLPSKPTIITEYGAGSDPRIRSLKPVRFDFSVEWQNRFLQHNLHEIYQRPFIAGAAIWNLFDFGSESRNDAVPHINSKGLMTFDREPKDGYFLLQSWFRDNPILKIGSAGWEKRAGTVADDDSAVAYQPIEVYGNVGHAELFIHDTSLGEKELTRNKAEWWVPFKDGRNVLRVTSRVEGAAIHDRAVIDFNLYKRFNRSQKKLFKDIYINVGANFYFIDKMNDIIWQPDTAYREGFWGHGGGERYTPRNRGVGTDADILGTQRDPLFQTQRVEAETYRIDVPEGRYEILLLFAALKEEESQFEVSINGEIIFDSITLSERNHAIIKKAEVYTDQPQLEITFQPVQGSPVINGIGIRKIN